MSLASTATATAVIVYSRVIIPVQGDWGMQSKLLLCPAEQKFSVLIFW